MEEVNMQRAVRREVLWGRSTGTAGACLAPQWFGMLPVVCLSVLVLLMLSGASVQAQPAAGKAKVDRLVMGLITPYLDYWRPWINGTADHNIQHDPAFEWLVEIDPETGKYKPWLADELADAGRQVVEREAPQGRAIPPRLWRVYGQGCGAQSCSVV